MVLGCGGGGGAFARRASNPTGLLELPVDVLKDIFKLLQTRDDAEIEEEEKERADGTWRPDVAMKIPELAAFRCVSKAAKKVADAAVELLHYQYESLSNLSDLSEEAMITRMLVHLRLDLLRWRNVSRLHLLLPFRHALPPWLATLAARPTIVELRIKLARKNPYPAPGETAPLDLPMLASFPTLQTLHLANIALGRDTLEAVARLPALTHLALKVLNLERISLPCMPQLQQLSLVGFECGGFREYAPLFEMADASPWASLETLAVKECRLPVPWKISPGTFPSLTSLSLEKLPNQTITRLDLRPLPAVKHLTLKMCIMREGSLPDLSPLSSLQSLDVSYFEASGLSALVNLTTLESLSLSGMTSYVGRDVYAPWVASLPRLRSLCSKDCLAPAAVTGLTTLESLTLSLDIVRENCTGFEPHFDLGALQGLTSLDLFLRCLSISPLECLDPGRVRVPELRGLERLKSLRALRLQGFSHAQVPGLSSLTALQKLNAMFDLTPTCPRVLPVIEGLSSLHTLRLTNSPPYGQKPLTPCPSGGVLHLSGLPLLRSLDMENMAVQSIVGLERLRNLEVVSLANLSGLRQLPNLTVLSGLRQLRLDDLPIAGALHVDRLTSLQTLTLSLSAAAPPVCGLEHCVGLKYLSLHTGARSCGRWIHSLRSLETVNIADLPFRQWLFKARDGREMFIFSSSSGGRDPIYEVPWHPVLKALRAGGRVEEYEDIVEDGFEDDEFEDLDDQIYGSEEDDSGASEDEESDGEDDEEDVEVESSESAEDSEELEEDGDDEEGESSEEDEVDTQE